VIKRGPQFVLVFLAVIASVWFLSRDGPHSAARSAPVGTAVKVGFNVGESAPDFELRSLDGRTVRLSDFRGKPVLLNFWASWCAPCRVEMPWLVELDQQYRPLGIEIVGVSLDDPGAEQDVAKFVAERGVRYTILIGDSAVADVYGGARFLPQSFFIDRDGTITKTSFGLTDKHELEEGLKKLLANADATIHPESKKQ
jgi:peroxiredoxin